MSINKAVISGNLGADPELRSTSSGKYVLTFNVAVNESVPDGNGGWSERVNWIECTVFGNRASALERILKKGSKVAVSGRLRYRTWEKGGHNYSKVGIVADEVDLMSTRSAEPAPDAPDMTDEPSAGVYDEDIPF